MNHLSVRQRERRLRESSRSARYQSRTVAKPRAFAPELSPDKKTAGVRHSKSSGSPGTAISDWQKQKPRIVRAAKFQ